MITSPGDPWDSYPKFSFPASVASTNVMTSALFLFMTRIRSPGSIAPTEPSSSCIIDPDSTTTIGGNEPVDIHIEPSSRTTNPIAIDPSLTNGLTVRVSGLSESESGASSDTSFLLGASPGLYF